MGAGGMTVLSILALICVGASGQSTGVERPCGDAQAVDVACVRAHLAARSDCTPVVDGLGLDPYYPADIMFLYPHYFNLTLVMSGSTYTGLSQSVVSDFVVDSTNDVTIISLLHPFIDLVGHLLPKGRRGISEANLKTWTLIPGTSYLGLSNRQTHYYQTTETYITFSGGNLQSYVDSDPLVKAVVEALKANLHKVVHDSLYSMSKAFADAVIGFNLCSLNEDEPLFQNYAL